MGTVGNWSAAVHRVHVEGRTPGDFGAAPMTTIIDGIPSASPYVGTHHASVYLAAIEALSNALHAGHANVVVTSPSEHLVNHMNGTWMVGDELRPFHEVVTILCKHFAKVTWDLAPRTP